MQYAKGFAFCGSNSRTSWLSVSTYYRPYHQDYRGSQWRDWRRLDERIEHVTEEIEELAHGTEGCRQLMTVPGIGPIIATAMVAAIGSGTAFARGRDFAACSV